MQFVLPTLLFCIVFLALPMALSNLYSRTKHSRKWVYSTFLFHLAILVGVILAAVIDNYDLMYNYFGIVFIAGSCWMVFLLLLVSYKTWPSDIETKEPQGGTKDV